MYPFLTFEKIHKIHSDTTHNLMHQKGASARLIVLFSPKFPKLPVPRKSREMSSVCTVCMGQIWDMKRSSKYQSIKSWMDESSNANLPEGACFAKATGSTPEVTSSKKCSENMACLLYVLYCFIRVNHVLKLGFGIKSYGLSE